MLRLGLLTLVNNKHRSKLDKVSLSHSIQSFAKQSSVLSVQVYGKGLFGTESLGQCKSIAIADLLQQTQGNISGEKIGFAINKQVE